MNYLRSLEQATREDGLYAIATALLVSVLLGSVAALLFSTAVLVLMITLCTGLVLAAILLLAQCVQTLNAHFGRGKQEVEGRSSAPSAGAPAA